MSFRAIPGNVLALIGKRRGFTSRGRESEEDLPSRRRERLVAPPRKYEGRIAFAATFTAVAILPALWRLDGVLAGLHEPGQAGYRMKDLPQLGLHEPRVADVELIVEAWTTDTLETSGLTGAVPITAWYLALDTVFVLAYVGLLVVLFRFVARAIAATIDAANASASSNPSKAEELKRLSATAELYAAMLVWGSFAVPLLGLFDFLENVASYVAISGYSSHPDAEFADAAAVAVFFASAGKWLMFVVVAPALLVPAGWRARQREPGLGRTVLALHLPILLSAVYGIALLGPLGGPQATDVMLRWLDEPSELVAAVVLTAWTSAILFAVCPRLLDWTARRLDKRLPPGALALVGAALIFLGGSAWYAVERGEGVVPLGVLAVLVAVLSLPFGNPPIAQPRYQPRHRKLVSRLLAAAPPVCLGVALTRSAVVEWVYAGDVTTGILVPVGIIVQLFGWGVAWNDLVAERLLRPRWVGSRTGLVVSSVGAAIFAILIWSDPFKSAEAAGTVGVLAAFTGSAVLAGFAVQRVFGKWAAPPALAMIGFRRVPIVTVLLAWAAAASLLDEGGYHDVRIRAYSTGLPVENVEDAWQRWLETSGADVPAEAGPGGRRPAVPLVLVAAAGGGIRAAYWTTRALECVLEGRPERDCGGADRRRDVVPFALSGASGGSLGLVTHVSASLEMPLGDGWVDAILGRDYLGPTIAWGLYVDLPNALLRVDPPIDRAEVLERSWERAWDAPWKRAWNAMNPDDNARFAPASPLTRGMRALWSSEGPQPLLMLNGTSVEDGCRFVASPLGVDVDDGSERKVDDCVSLAPFEASGEGEAKITGREREKWTLAATQDLTDLLCPNEDVRLSTAALLSARFPLVSPSGRLTQCTTGEADFVVDGGYFDNSAASAVVDLWERLEQRVYEHNRDPANSCVVPVLLQIDNRYTERLTSTPKRRPFESAAPLQAIGGARTAREASGRQSAAMEFRSDSFGTVAKATVRGKTAVRYAHLYPRQHPGTTAPLGWTLSEASRSDLDDQLFEGRGRPDLNRAVRWFDPSLSCEG